MSTPLSHAIKLRDNLLADLQSEDCLAIWKNDDTFARDLEKRLLAAKPFYVDQSAMDFMLESMMALSPEDFYQGIANSRMPFEETWLEIGATTPDGKHYGRIGAMMDRTEEGLRVYTVQLFKFPKKKNPLTILYSGTQILFRRDGTVEMEATPLAHFYDALEEGEAGKLTREKIYSNAPFDAETIRAREKEDLQLSTKCAALVVAFASLHNRPEIIKTDDLSPVSKKAKKSLENRGLRIPEFKLSKIQLGKNARNETQKLEAKSSNNEDKKRTAHWVRGHIFLARNGKLTWRKAHIRGVGKPAPRARQITTQ